MYYRIFWKSPATSPEFRKSPLVFTQERADKIVKSMSKLCKKNVFEIKESHNHKELEICPDHIRSLEEILSTLRRLK